MAEHVIAYVKHGDDTSDTLTIEWRGGSYQVTERSDEIAPGPAGIVLVVDKGEPEIVTQKAAQRFRRDVFYRLADEAYRNWQSGR